MTSIFDLKTNVDQLSSTNEGTSRMEYEQHPPTRDVSRGNFANGAIHFRFQTSGQKWWLPSRSYVRTRMRIRTGAAAPNNVIDIADDVAPNMGIMSNIFQSAEFRINDKTVSRVADFMPQVDALNTRLTKSSSWLESIGESTNFWTTKQSVRQSEISSDGLLVTANTVTDTQDDRIALGFDAVGAGNNNASYVAATGVITFSVGAAPGGALPADVRTVFPPGSFFMYTAATNVAASAGIKMEVITGLNGAGAGSATTIVVRPVLPADENGAAGAAAFVRVNDNSAGTASRRIGDFETTWQPPLSLFKIEHALPSGRYEMVLNPQTSAAFQQRAIESVLGQASKNPQLAGAAANAANISVEIVDMYFYCATVDGPRSDDITYLLDLEQTRCQSEKIDNTSFQQKNFDVSPSTYALTVAYQDLRAGTNTAISSSKFKSYDNAQAGAIPTTIDESLKLNRMFINYAGQNLPAPDADPNFTPQTGAAAGIDFTTQRYSESQIYSGAYFDSGGAETIQQYHERGSYYYFAWPRDGTDRSTRVNVHQSFDAADVTNMRVLLFDHSKQVARIKVQDGRVVDVQIEDA